MTGILPLITAGGVVTRDAAGAATNPPGVQNAYVPGVDFNFTCEPTALPSTCDARIFPSQINAIMSELISLGECFDSDGTWDCASLTNLCSLFNQWVADNPDVLTSLNVNANGDGLVYTDEQGNDNNIPLDVFFSEVTDNGDGTYTHTSGDGTTTDIDTNAVGCDELKARVNDLSCVPNIDQCDDNGATLDLGDLRFLSKRFVGGVAQLEGVNLEDILTDTLNTIAESQNYTNADFGAITHNTGANRLDYLTNPNHDIVIPAIVIPPNQCRCTDTHVHIQAETRVTLLNATDNGTAPNSVMNVDSRLVYDGPGPSRAPTSITQGNIFTADDAKDRDSDTRVETWMLPIQRDGNGVCTVGPFRAQFRSNSSGVGAGAGVEITNYILGYKISGVVAKRLA